MATDHTPSLFTDGLAAWRADPVVAFDSWLVKEGIGQSSAVVYRALWNSYATWAKVHRVDMFDIAPSDMERFLDSLQIRRQQRERYHRLIERVLDDVHSRQAGTTNAARMAKTLRGLGWRDVEGNDPTGFLTPALRQAIIAWGDAVPCTVPDDAVPDKDTWRNVRNRALIGVFLGGGLKVAEARGLTLNCMNFAHGPWLWVRPKRQPMRQVALDDYAVRWVQEWSRVRQAAHTAGTWLFPGDRAGSPISVATISRLVHAFMSRAAPDDPLALAVTAQTLRNDRAAQMLEDEASHADIAERLGFADLVSVARMEVAFKAWQHDHPDTNASVA